jgi:DNA polymerase I-like protein with 3'-5' exonuclease and polymerase domains
VADYSQIELRLLARMSRDPLPRRSAEAKTPRTGKGFRRPPIMITSELRRRQASAASFMD